MPDRNRDFLPPEVIDTLRLSDNPIIKQLFTNKLTRTGNLWLSFDEELSKVKRSRCKSSSSSDEASKVFKTFIYNLRTYFLLEIILCSQAPADQTFSQIKKMRTSVSIFKSLSLDLLKELSIGGDSGGTHFVRCVRSNIQNSPKTFQTEIIRQQLRAMSIVETAKARQKGFPYRIPFNEFLRR